MTTYRLNNMLLISELLGLLLFTEQYIEHRSTNATWNSDRNLVPK